jgi:hypothetical protein
VLVEANLYVKCLATAACKGKEAGGQGADMAGRISMTGQLVLGRVTGQRIEPLGVKADSAKWTLRHAYK